MVVSCRWLALITSVTPVVPETERAWMIDLMAVTRLSVRCVGVLQISAAVWIPSQQERLNLRYLSLWAQHVVGLTSACLDDRFDSCQSGFVSGLCAGPNPVRCTF